MAALSFQDVNKPLVEKVLFRQSKNIMQTIYIYKLMIFINQSLTI